MNPASNAHAEPIVIVYQMFPLGFTLQVLIIRTEAWTSGER
ncbi:hypothetical protein [Paenibacillus polymyxa]|nr:hypothetical protein [Paenibacillus polymyxa]MDY8024283.1 hypothetical protein [Paenibacillus polymyxa]